MSIEVHPDIKIKMYIVSNLSLGGTIKAILVLVKKNAPKAIILIIMIHLELHVKLYEELTTKETEIIMNQCYMTS